MFTADPAQLTAPHVELRALQQKMRVVYGIDAWSSWPDDPATAFLIVARRMVQAYVDARCADTCDLTMQGIASRELPEPTAEQGKAALNEAIAYLRANKPHDAFGTRADLAQAERPLEGVARLRGFATAHDMLYQPSI